MAFLSPYLVHITSSCWLASLGLEFCGPVISMNNIQVPCGHRHCRSQRPFTSAFLFKDRVWLAPEVLVSQTPFSSLLTGGAGLLFTSSPPERGERAGVADQATVCDSPAYPHLLEFKSAGWTVRSFRVRHWTSMTPRIKVYIFPRINKYNHELNKS